VVVGWGGEVLVKVRQPLGISVAEVGRGKWRLRWRQNERQPDGSVARPQGELYTYSVAERKRLEVDIEAQLAARG
jgi:hypothetical protein